jgi:spermidine/putrescine-binding protein
MKDNKIIGFNLSLNFVFKNENKQYKEVINKVEDMLDELFPNGEDTDVMLLGGKAEYIREKNDLGIEKL